MVVGAWRQDSWDANDTVLIADPRKDADVGRYFTQLLGTAAFTSWHDQRIGGALGAAQQAAAVKAAAHAKTPAVTHFDALGRACLAVADCGDAGRFPTRSALDTAGKPLAVSDALGHRTEQYVLASAAGGPPYLAGTDMVGGQIYRVNADAGIRRALADAAGQPLRAWDARGHAFRFVSDAARRPTQRWVSTASAPEILAELTVWGEGQAAAANLAGRAFRHYDMGGFVENTAYDYAGNLITGRRQLGTAYRAASNWSPLVGRTQGADLDATAQAANLIPSGDGGRDSFVQSTVYDALARPIQTVAPHSAGMKPNVFRPAYDVGAQLFAVDVWLQEAAPPSALLDPATADRHAVTSIAYNARGQRVSIAFGNGVTSARAYDPETFRLTNLVTTRPAATFPAAQQTVQDLSYVYDPVGNITHIQDDADTQNVIFFANQRVEPSADYAYDPLYRLTAATGREHLGQTGGALNAPSQVTADDSFRLNLPQPGDGQAMGTYAETYAYDAVGNLLAMSHQVGKGNWTRRYAYREPSRINPGEVGNRLSSTSLPGDPDAGPYSAGYGYDAHGSMTLMPHLPAMTWDEDDRLRSTTRQVVNAGTPGTSYYVYGSDAGRVRKASDGQANAGQVATRTAERIYLGPVEVYREYAADGTTITLSRETLHVDAGGVLVALVETSAPGSDGVPAQQVRYQHANHLGSALLELGDDGGIITYEEYFPFGATSYQAVGSQTDAPKRYRFTGKERDAENDLYYHGARYYAPWLGRWTSCDSLDRPHDRSGFHETRYGFVLNNPVKFHDPDGHDPVPAVDDQKRPSSWRAAASVDLRNPNVTASASASQGADGNVHASAQTTFFTDGSGYSLRAGYSQGSGALHTTFATNRRLALGDTYITSMGLSAKTTADSRGLTSSFDSKLSLDVPASYLPPPGRSELVGDAHGSLTLAPDLSVSGKLDARISLPVPILDVHVAAKFSATLDSASVELASPNFKPKVDLRYHGDVHYSGTIDVVKLPVAYFRGSASFSQRGLTEFHNIVAGLFIFPGVGASVVDTPPSSIQAALNKVVQSPVADPTSTAKPVPPQFVGLGLRADYVGRNLALTFTAGFGASLNDKNIPTVGANALTLSGSYNIPGF
jgi:RHS repeat-associated protein